jgi:hypothetical protein
MAELYLWATAGTFALVGIGMARHLGLLDEVPRDPKARVAGYSSAVLMVLKDQLIGSQLESWNEHRVEYIRKGAASSLWVEDGALICRQGQEQLLYPVGDLGKLAFSFSGDEMSIQIRTAESGGAEHSTQVTVRMLPPKA